MKDDLQSLWMAQPTADAPAMSTSELDRRSRAFARRIKFRNARESLAAGLVMAGFALLAAYAGPVLVRVGSALIVVAAAWVSLTLHRRGRVAPAPPADAPTSEHLTHYRTELERQRVLLAGAVRWYLAPFAPGLLLYFVGTALDQAPGAAPAVRAAFVIGSVVVTVLVFVGVAVVNRRAVRALGREIEALASGAESG